MECLFCKIINKELPAEIVYQDKKTIAFRDIRPQAPVHLLITPKEHIKSIKSPGAEDIASLLISAAKKISQAENISDYKLVFNVGRQAGQTVDHLHLHLLAGQDGEKLSSALKV